MTFPYFCNYREQIMRDERSIRSPLQQIAPLSSMLDNSKPMQLCNQNKFLLFLLLIPLEQSFLQGCCPNVIRDINYPTILGMIFSLSKVIMLVETGFVVWAVGILFLLSMQLCSFCVILVDYKRRGRKTNIDRTRNSSPELVKP